MMESLFEWIIVGAANRIVVAAPDLDGVTPDEAFLLLTTERGRHARYFAHEIVRAWNCPQPSISALN